MAAGGSQMRSVSFAHDGNISRYDDEPVPCVQEPVNGISCMGNGAEM
jgi:uncharacterized protein with gpF-like domain